MEMECLKILLFTTKPLRDKALCHIYPLPFSFCHFISQRFLDSILAGACCHGYITHGHSHILAITAWPCFSHLLHDVNVVVEQATMESVRWCLEKYVGG